MSFIDPVVEVKSKDLQDVNLLMEKMIEMVLMLHTML